MERDFLGEVELPDEYPFGIHTRRAERNFAFTSGCMRADWFAAVVQVKRAAARANRRAGLLDEPVAAALEGACAEVLADVAAWVPPLHPLQGGAGTSMNMAANELLANLALRGMGRAFGEYGTVSPLEHVNLSQSTNDVVPTALRVAVRKGLGRLHQAVEGLLRALQEKERRFAHILKVGRTQLQDAVPLALGQEFGAWAEALERFRWRLDKALDWVREVNLGGTAVGTGVNADRLYAASVVEELRRITEEPLALARNRVDATQNLDPLVEVSGMVRSGAVSIKKIAADLRLLSSGPHCGLGELRLPPLQAGSSIMPGKVNPVLLEAAEQVALQVMAGDALLAAAAAESDLELPQFLPLVGHTLLESLELLAGMAERLAPHLAGIAADEARIARHLDRCQAVATLLAPAIGYDAAAALVQEAAAADRGVVELLREKGLLPEETLRKLLTPEVMAAPGVPLLDDDKR